MPKVKVLNMAGKEVSEITLSDAVFGITPNEAVMHAAVVNYLANHRNKGERNSIRRSCRRSMLYSKVKLL